ncbi:hypothetical protein BJY01DRAFT_35411 [Aspergillus pseudoustus]|uniref:Uncharacterized protein n=1 Tax=Aspergillus pseudoustus TaxID=1810923 RepID=A0ABR4JGI8_9EURO
MTERIGETPGLRARQNATELRRQSQGAAQNSGAARGVIELSGQVHQSWLCPKHPTDRTASHRVSDGRIPSHQIILFSCLSHILWASAASSHFLAFFSFALFFVFAVRMVGNVAGWSCGFLTFASFSWVFLSLYYSIAALLIASFPIPPPLPCVRPTHRQSSSSGQVSAYCEACVCTPYALDQFAFCAPSGFLHNDCHPIPSFHHFLAEDTRHRIDSPCNVEADRPSRFITNLFVCYPCSRISPRVSDSNPLPPQHLYHRQHIDDPCISHPIDNPRRYAHEYIETPRAFSYEASVHNQTAT